MKIVNRAMIIVCPQRPMVDWINRHTDITCRLSGDEVGEDSTAYLVEEYETPMELEEILRSHYREIFEEQLESWISDPETWPPNRSYEAFRQFFRVTCHSVVIDTGEAPLHQESY